MITNDVANPRLRDFVRRKLGLPKFGNGFDKAVEEMFLREHFVLNLKPEELLEDLNNFAESVKGIEWTNLEENFLGCYYPGEKKIKLNAAYFQNLFNIYSVEEVYQAMFETISHECLHGTQTNKYGKNRAEGYNREIGNRTHALYEIATQATAAKMARNRTKEDSRKNAVLTGDGYSDEIFAMPLLAATFGVKEQDVIKYSMREREKLIELLDTNIGNKSITADLVNRIEVQLEYIHSALYPDPQQKDFKNLDSQGKLKVTSAGIYNLLNICQEAMANRIKNMSFDYNKNTIDNLVYDYIKVNNTIEYQVQNFGTSFFSSNQAEFFDQIQRNGPYANYIKNSVIYLSALNQPKNRYLQPYASDIISAIKFEDYQYLSSINLFPEDYMLRYSGSVKEEHDHDDYNNFRVWDNQELYYALINGCNPNQTVHRERFDASGWKNINTLDGLEKLAALKYAFPSNKKRYSIKTKNALLDMLDQTGMQFDENFYSMFTRNNMPIATDLSQAVLSPRDAMRKNFNKPDDQVFIASLIADRFVKKAYDEYGHIKRLENAQETEIQTLLWPTLEKCMNERHQTPEESLNQLRFALKKILLNDDYQSISHEECRQMLSMYGKRGVFDIVSQSLVDELLSERRIIPQKREAFNFIVSKTLENHPDEGSIRIISALNGFRRGVDQDSISFNFSTEARPSFNYFFRTQRDYEDMLGIICDEYSRQNYQTTDTQDSITNPDIQEVLNALGPDEFRESVIDVFFRNDYSRITNPRIRQVLFQNPNYFIQRMADTYSKNAKKVYNYDRWANNAYYGAEKFSKNNGLYTSTGFAVPKVSLVDIRQIVDQEVGGRGIFRRINGFLGNFSQITRGQAEKNQDKDEEVK